MSSLVPDTDNFFKYLLTIGVLMVLFGLIYPLKQEQALRTKLIEIKEKDSLLRIEVEFLEGQVKDLELLQKQTQIRVDELKRKKIGASAAEQVLLDEKISSIADFFYNKRSVGLMTGKDVKLKNAKLIYEKARYDETNHQIKEYLIFKTTFWGLGFLLTAAGLFFWMDSTYYDELVKIQAQATYQSKYAQCVTYTYTVTQKYRWWIVILTIILIGFATYFFSIGA